MKISERHLIVRVVVPLGEGARKPLVTDSAVTSGVIEPTGAKTLSE